MCGRYVSPDTAAIERTWHIGRTNNNPFRKRYNVAPTMQVPIIRRAADADELELTEAQTAGAVGRSWAGAAVGVAEDRGDATAAMNKSAMQPVL